MTVRDDVGFEVVLLDVETGESFVLMSGVGGTIWYRIAVRPDGPADQASS